MTKNKEISIIRKEDSTACKIVKTIMFILTSLFLVHLGLKSPIDKTCDLMSKFGVMKEKISTFIEFIEEHKDNIKTQIKYFIIDIFKALFIISIIMIVNYANVRYQPAVVNGNSMSPTLNNGDLIIIDTWKTPKDGDILSINTDWITDYDNKAGFIVKRYCEEKSTTGYYLLGDNSKVSYDSRFYGEVDKRGLQGVIVYSIPGIFKDKT